MKTIKLIVVRQLHNCDELVDFIINELNNYEAPYVIFEGFTCEVTKTTLDYAEQGIVRNNTLITISPSFDRYLEIHALKGEINFGNSYNCIVIPNYVEEELIATLKGE